MKLELQNLKDLRECPHCFCLNSFVETSELLPLEQQPKEYPGVVAFKPKNIPHKQCCNCGLKKKS